MGLLSNDNRSVDKILIHYFGLKLHTLHFKILRVATIAVMILRSQELSLPFFPF